MKTHLPVQASLHLSARPAVMLKAMPMLMGFLLFTDESGLINIFILYYSFSEG